MLNCTFKIWLEKKHTDAFLLRHPVYDWWKVIYAYIE